MSEGRPLKVRKVSSSCKIGIVGKNLEDVLEKGCTKLKIPQAGASICLERDGTQIVDDDYLQTVPDNECLVVLSQGKQWIGGMVYHLEELQRWTQDLNLASEIKDFINEEPFGEKQRIMIEIVDSQQGNIDAENRADDPDWFRDVDQRYRTKSDAMFAKAQERIRGYYSKTKEMLAKTTYTSVAEVRHDSVRQSLVAKLKAEQFHGVYFRRHPVGAPGRLCDDNGGFSCQGEYDQDQCLRRHFINPYQSRDARVLFSTWNLDHIIEKSRQVIPGLVEAIGKCPQTKTVNWNYFYDLLFTINNLKLVDIRCHNKRLHTGRVQKARYYSTLISRR